MLTFASQRTFKSIFASKSKFQLSLDLATADALYLSAPGNTTSVPGSVLCTMRVETRVPAGAEMDPPREPDTR